MEQTTCGLDLLKEREHSQVRRRDRVEPRFERVQPSSDLIVPAGKVLHGRYHIQSPRLEFGHAFAFIHMHARHARRADGAEHADDLGAVKELEVVRRA
ncbi:MAG: hypothetical protein ACYDDF_03155 [Thermoplasmatota archaeon]